MKAACDRCVVVCFSLVITAWVLSLASAFSSASAAELWIGAATAAKEPQQLLDEARKSLTGQPKNEAAARRLLVDLVQNHVDGLSPAELCRVYVYLGYIEDRAGNRDAAISWYKKAIPLDGPNIQGIRDTAALGLTKPLIRLRHLDQDRSTPRDAQILERVGDAVIARDMPANLPSPEMHLSEAERLANFDLLWQSIDRWYSFFEHKKIDWTEVKARYRPKVQTAEKAADYYRVLNELVRELRDPHSWLCNYKDENELQWFSPAIATRRIGGRVIVIHVADRSAAADTGLRPGSAITGVDGLSVDEKLEQLRPRLRMSSSERHFLEYACRRILHGEQGTTVSISLLPPGEKTPAEVRLVRDTKAVEEVREPDFPVQKARYVWSGVHSSGYGYIRITSFMGRMELADEFDRALEGLKNTPALMIDIRDNPGGYGIAHARIVGRFLSGPAAVGASWRKNGPGHTQFKRVDLRLVPTGPWQYTKPIALLMNEITGSASDLFARDLIATGRPLTVGATTHGNSTGTCVFVTIPCNLVVRVSAGFTGDSTGRIIEGNGHVPDIPVELTVDDILSRTDPVVDRAVKALTAASSARSGGASNQEPQTN